MPQKKISSKAEILINGSVIEQVQSFNFLGLTIDEHLSWKPHTDRIQNKLIRTMGIINKLKHFLPLEIKKILYNSLVLPHLSYNLLLWGHRSKRLAKIQKKIVRIINCSSYYAHTNNFFKDMKMLKIEDLFSLTKYKFYFNYCQNKLPAYFNNINLNSVSDIHNRNTRNNNNLFIPRIEHSFASSSIRYSIPKFINDAPEVITAKIYTHSPKGFKNYIKNWFIEGYSNDCSTPNCYSCSLSTISTR